MKEKTIKKRRGILKSLNSFLIEKQVLLSAWASVVTIASLVIVVFGGIYTTIQLMDYYSKADLHLEFVYPDSVAFLLYNSSKKLADRPSYGFAMWDLNTNTLDPLPIPWTVGDFVAAHGYQGPNALMKQYGIKGHKYLGVAGVTCPNCETLRSYVIYIDNEDYTKSWYAETTSKAGGDMLPPVPLRLRENPEKYLKEYLSALEISERIPIRKTWGERKR